MPIFSTCSTSPSRAQRVAPSPPPSLADASSRSWTTRATCTTSPQPTISVGFAPVFPDSIRRFRLTAPHMLREATTAQGRSGYRSRGISGEGSDADAALPHEPDDARRRRPRLGMGSRLLEVPRRTS